MFKTKLLIDQLKKQPLYLIIGVVLLYLCVQGIIKSWIDLKHNIVINELKKQGIELEIQEVKFIEQKIKLDTVISQNIEEVKKIDYQQYKKTNNQKIKDKFKNEKGIIITDSDIDFFKQDPLLSKYK